MFVARDENKTFNSNRKHRQTEIRPTSSLRQLASASDQIIKRNVKMSDYYDLKSFLAHFLYDVTFKYFKALVYSESYTIARCDE